jgi:cellulose biosynthesis protein BcsQ
MTPEEQLLKIDAQIKYLRSQMEDDKASYIRMRIDYKRKLDELYQYRADFISKVENNEDEVILIRDDVSVAQAQKEIYEYMEGHANPDELDYFDLMRELRIEFEVIIKACSELRTAGYLE